MNNNVEQNEVCYNPMFMLKSFIDLASDSTHIRVNSENGVVNFITRNNAIKRIQSTLDDITPWHYRIYFYGVKY